MAFKQSARRFLSDLQIRQPAGFETGLSNLIAAMNLQGGVDSDVDSLIASGWRRFLDLDNSILGQDTIEKICLLGAFHSLTASHTTSLSAAFSKERLNFSRSRLEMSLRLASRLYMLGRKTKFGTVGLVDGLRLLSAAVRFFDEAIQQQDRLNPPTLRKLFGMRGVAQLLIARTGDLSLAKLKQAISDLDQSHKLGDATPQNLVYRRECALRLYELERKTDHLDQLAKMFEERGAVNRQYYTDLAWYHSFRMQLVLDQSGNAKAALTLGLEACNKGLEIPLDMDVPDTILFNLRGFLYLMSVKLHYSMEREVSDRHLDLAIDDLRRAAVAQLGGASLAIALLRRSSSLKKENDLTKAEHDLQEGIASTSIIADSVLALKVRRSLECSLLDCTITRNIEADDRATLFDSCRLLLSYEDDVTRYAFTLIWAVRVLIKEFVEQPIPDQIRSLAEATIEISERHIENLPPDDAVGNARAYLANISRKIDLKSVSRRTLVLFRSAIDGSNKPNAELYSTAADVALRFAKSLAREGRAEEAASLFADAAQWYERAFEVFDADPAVVSENFLPVVCHSKVGEAYLRMRRGIGGSVAIASKAIEHLTAARRLGNETAELLGLLGDGYYRRGYPTSNKDDLIRAVELKVGAQKTGQPSRENWSILGRLYLRLYEILRDVKYLGLAFQAIYESNALSPDWPWPLFQLAELADLPAGDRAAALSHCPERVAKSEFIKALELGDRVSILSIGAKLAVDGTEFPQDIIGGKARVFVVDDPHRLLSTTIILKPTTQRNADVEFNTTKAFGDYLQTSGLGQRFGVPVPIAVVPSTGSAVTYVMERTRATLLSDIVLGEFAGGYRGEIPEVTNTLELLQLYHRWNGVKEGGQQWRVRFVADFKNLINRVGMSAEELRESVKLFDELLPNTMPHVRKKDAHPENWLVTNRGKIVMIDLEATSWQPALLEVAQLIDDYPIFSLDKEGWRSRISIANRYWKSVFGYDLAEAEIEALYAAVVIYRCVFGLLRCNQNSDASSSSLRAVSLRIRHFGGLLSYIATSSPIPSASRLAATLSRKTRTLARSERVDPSQDEVDDLKLIVRYGPSNS